MAKNKGYKTPNEKFDAEFADLSANPVQKKVKQAQSQGQSQGQSK
ncbi:hypothetical protein [Paenibacillus caui]|nr:hypothetical protein [Paenibacillus caui]